MIIKALESGHCPQVAKLHLLYLKSSFQGVAGQRLLEIYYRSVAAQQGACGYVGALAGEIGGYICGVWNRRQLITKMSKDGLPDILIWGLRQGSSSPRILLNLPSRLTRNSFNIQSKCNGIELRPIVVAPSQRGSGLAVQLVERLLLDAQQRGFDCIFLFTEVWNIPAQKLYEKCGFGLRGEVTQSGEQYLNYEYAL